MGDTPRGIVGRAASSYAVVVIVAVLIGAAIAPYAYGAATADGGSVAVVELSGPITTGVADEVAANLREARQNDSIDAVVLRVNSPGGAAAASEELYLAVKRTAEVMPVVASVGGFAASGAYYTIAPSDRIYVTPASGVGSIGVRAQLPEEGIPDGEIVTGPDKATGGTAADVRRQVETLRRAFVGAVVDERGEALELSGQELSHAKVYSGARGVQLGLADEVAGLDAAIATAAGMAGLSNYDVVRYDSPVPGLGLLFQADGGNVTVSADDPFGYRGVETVKYLMLYGHVDGETDANTISSREVSDDAS